MLNSVKIVNTVCYCSSCVVRCGLSERDCPKVGHYIAWNIYHDDCGLYREFVHYCDVISMLIDTHLQFNIFLSRIIFGKVNRPLQWNRVVQSGQICCFV